ncbi:GNAT family N-acetyltransferase [Radiobacillus sp. PE A8.2]|uniref:GNAT family N-acetyltransferase n=1 Tax=Radiobacillus sp. PE A8.2 TaxID=3380349 RepID=UPI0038905A00
MTFPNLETNRLKLVEVIDMYSEPFYEMMSLDEVTHYYGMESLKSMEQANKVIDSFRDSWSQKRGIRWAMVRKDDNKFIGTIGLNNLVLSHKRTEVGYEIHPSYWRSGYTSEALQRVIEYCFEELQLIRIGAFVYTANDASSALLKKLGFVQEGLLRSYYYQRGTGQDVYVYSRLNTEKQS